MISNEISENLTFLEEDEDEIFANNELMFYWDSISRSPLKGLNIKIIRVFIGGRNSIQSTKFTGAWYRLNFDTNDYIVEYINVDDVKKQSWTTEQFINWLLTSHVHFILSHVHQGLRTLNWNMENLGIQLSRLKYHPGFPKLTNLQCPVFLQNKYAYIESCPSCNITKQIFLTESGEFSEIIQAEIKRQVF